MVLSEYWKKLEETYFYILVQFLIRNCIKYWHLVSHKNSMTFKIEPIGSIALDYNTLALFHKGVSFCSAFEASLYRAHIACHHSAAT